MIFSIHLSTTPSSSKVDFHIYSFILHQSIHQLLFYVPSIDFFILDGTGRLFYIHYVFLSD